MVHVVGSHCRTDEFLEQIVVLIHGTCRGESCHSVRAIVFFDFFDFAGNQIQSFFPGSPLQFSVLSDHRIFQTVFVVDEVIGKFTLHTEKPLVGRSVSRGGVHDLSILHGEIDLASHTAVSAGGTHLLHFPLSEIIQRFRHQSPHWTDGDTVTTGHAVGLCHGSAALWHHIGIAALLSHD